MNIICIEDLKEKYEHINEVLKQENIQSVWRKNYQEGLTELMNTTFDYLLLDMSMPICDDEFSKNNFDNFGGLSILREIKRRRYKIKVIVVTGFNDFERGNEIITINELENEIINKYKQYYLGFIKYDSSSVEWQEKLKQLLKIKE